jgi:hypothetical protein
VYANGKLDLYHVVVSDPASSLRPSCCASTFPVLQLSALQISLGQARTTHERYKGTCISFIANRNSTHTPSLSSADYLSRSLKILLRSMTDIFCRIFSSGKQKRKDEKRVAKRTSAEPGSIDGDTSWNLGRVTSSCLESVGRKREGKSTVLKANSSQTTETGWAA